MGALIDDKDGNGRLKELVLIPKFRCRDEKIHGTAETFIIMVEDAKQLVIS